MLLSLLFIFREFSSLVFDQKSFNWVFYFTSNSICVCSCFKVVLGSASGVVFHLHEIWLSMVSALLRKDTVCVTVALENPRNLYCLFHEWSHFIAGD